MNFFDILLAKKLEDDRYPRVEGLSVTANGRYEETGVVYTPVIVNVPYDFDKKSLTNQPVASFDDAMNAPLYDLDIDIAPVQDLHGYANPWVGGAGKNKCGTFELGTWMESSNVGTTYNSMKMSNNARFRSANLIPVTFPMTISIADGYQYALIVFDENGGYLGSESLLSFRTTTYTQTTAWYENGSFVAFAVKRNDGADITSDDIANCHLQIEEGTTATTYAPYANICPISGWTEANVTACGKNLFDIPDIDKDTPNTTVTLNKPLSGYVTISANANNVTLSEAAWRFGVEFQDGTRAYIGDEGGYYPTFPMTFQVAEENPIVKYFYRGVTITSGTYEDIQFEFGTSATSYEPYTGETYSISFGAAGTVYGGTLDVTTGVLTVDRATVDMGTLNWYITSSASAEGGSVFAIGINDVGEGMAPRQRYTNNTALSSGYTTASSATWWVSDIHDFNISSNETALYVADSRYLDAPTFKASVDGVQLVYKLATPQTYQLTPEEIKTIFDQQNNIYADTGNVNNVTYLAVASE